MVGVLLQTEKLDCYMKKGCRFNAIAEFRSTEGSGYEGDIYLWVSSSGPTFGVFQYSTIEPKEQKCRAALGLTLHTIPRNLGPRLHTLGRMEQSYAPKGQDMARNCPAKTNKQTSNTLARVQQ